MLRTKKPTLHFTTMFILFTPTSKGMKRNETWRWGTYFIDIHKSLCPIVLVLVKYFNFGGLLINRTEERGIHTPYSAWG